MKNEKTNNTSAVNKANAWKYFEKHGFAEHKGCVLHHVDIDMKKNDFERYSQWIVSDLKVMTRTEHRKLHMKLEQKGRIRSKDHNKKISESMRNSEVYKSRVKIIMQKVEEKLMIFNTLAEAARYIGCSKALVSQCLRDNTKNKKACGWTIELI